MNKLEKDEMNQSENNETKQKFPKTKMEEINKANGTKYTLYLKIKKLSTNSSRDFITVLDTINHH